MSYLGNSNLHYIVIGNEQEWCTYSWSAVKSCNNVTFYDSIFKAIDNSLLRNICRKHFSLNWKRKGVHKHKRVSLPFRCIWYKLLFQSLGLNPNKNYRIIFYDWGAIAKDLGFIKYIKKHHPNVKMAYLFSNIVRISGAVQYGTLDKLSKTFDQVFAFDKVDAQNYQFEFSPLIYTRHPKYSESGHEFDVFYIGNAKDRLDSLHEIYKQCVDVGLRCNFYINGVSRDKQVYGEIHYNTPLSYREVLGLISKSKCMVDAIQGGSTAMTIKVCEAVIYDKKLITTNTEVVKEPYYTPERFLIYCPNCNIKDFVTGGMSVFSNDEKAFFSPEKLFEKIK